MAAYSELAVGRKRRNTDPVFEHEPDVARKRRNTETTFRHEPDFTTIETLVDTIKNYGHSDALDLVNDQLMSFIYYGKLLDEVQIDQLPPCGTLELTISACHVIERRGMDWRKSAKNGVRDFLHVFYFDR